MNFDELLTRIRNKLPIQNPLHSFVHNNILVMFEGKNFHEALGEAGALYRAQTYWPLKNYQDRFQEKKISNEDILKGIDHYLGHFSVCTVSEKLGITTKEFYYRLMFSELNFNDDKLQPKVNNEDLWKKCTQKMSGKHLILKRSKVCWRAKGYWEKYHNESLELSTQPFIIRLVSSYLDQGQSFWTNPFINKGFWAFFSFDVNTIADFSSGWQKVLVKKVAEYREKNPQEIIIAELGKMGIPESEWESFLLEIMFDLKGWSGMVNKLEVEPWQATTKAPQLKLIDYIAALLLVESSLDVYHAQEHSLDLSLIYGRQENVELRPFQLSLALYQITESFKLDPHWFTRLSADELLQIIDEVDEAEGKHQIRLWHEAFEHHFYREAIDALMGHKVAIPEEKTNPYAQVLFCIDDREESIRRHLEEVDHMVRTYGVVGFFGVDMKFSGVKNQRLIAQCPPVVNPRRIVKEVALNKNHGSSFDRMNRMIGGSDLSLYYHSRTMVRGYFSTLFLGMISIVPMFMQVFFPKWSVSLRAKLFNMISPIPRTEISIDSDGEGRGFTKIEQAQIVNSILKMCGLKGPASELVILIGHGSTSNNNPFKQAYGCGACGGNAGIPNSRAFAKMANDPAVRKELVSLGVEIPQKTYFVSGFHDTCTDEIHFFDLENMPESYRTNFARLRNNINQAAKLNAYERCQRFASTDAKSSPEQAIKHVRERAFDLAQPRPEYGHSTNALAIVGPRDLTKGLFLNRRSFLHTYDWALDPDGSTLAAVVLGGVPVAVNINMDYFFSCVDNDNFGCGSKLPLNLTSLLGVMTGSQSDLRIGLARQMIEIHEPVRTMTVIEAPLDRVKKLFDSHPRLRNILYHHWMRLVVKDPVSHKWYLFNHEDFEVLEKNETQLHHYPSSVELIDKTHLEEDFAEIEHD